MTDADGSPTPPMTDEREEIDERLTGEGVRIAIDAAGYRWSALTWGDPTGRPLLLIHGVTGSARGWWRVGPALANEGRRVVAVDLPGHGRTGGWQGRPRFTDTATDVIAFARAADLDNPSLQVVGHSWGAMVGASLANAGLRPATLVLLDPPTLSRAVMGAMADDPTWRTYPKVGEAIADLAAANPEWDRRDVEASALAMLDVDRVAARAVVIDNGDWDGGLAALDRAVDTWVVRGEPAAGGLTLEPAASAFRAALGEERVVTIRGAGHGPHRTHLEATLAALREALGPA